MSVTASLREVDGVLHEIKLRNSRMVGSKCLAKSFVGDFGRCLIVAAFGEWNVC